jgi:hypothetical protein
MDTVLTYLDYSSSKKQSVKTSTGAGPRIQDQGADVIKRNVRHLSLREERTGVNSMASASGHQRGHQ